MKLRALWVGRTKDPNLARLIDDYISRIEHFLPLQVVEVREPKAAESNRMEAEGKKLLDAIKPSDRLIVLDPKGRVWTSEIGRICTKAYG
jgi:23S rRNA (pseudouridine1915-N3)-methyltransferase